MTSGPDSSSGSDDLDDGTLFVRRGGAPTQPLDGEELEEATRWSRRQSDATGEPSTRQTPHGLDTDTGSTVVVRRESRRRAEAAAREAESDVDETIVGLGARPLAATVGGDVPAPLGRRAHAPHPADPVYDARSVRQPVIAAERAPRPAHTPQAPIDGVAAEALVRRRARRRAITVVGLASTVLIAAVAAVVVLAFAG